MNVAEDLNPMAVEAEDTGNGPDAEAEPTEAELIAEWEKATTTEPAKAQPAPANDTKKDPAKPANDTGAEGAANDTGEETLPEIEKRLRAREQARKAAEEQRAASLAAPDPERDQTAKELAEMRAWRAEQERKAKDLEERERSLSKAYDALKSDPMSFIKAAGWRADDLVNHVAREGSPEWQEIQRVRAENEALRKDTSSFKEFIEEQKKEREQWSRVQQQEAVTRIYREFLNEHLAPEKTPNARALWNDDDILRVKGDKISDLVFAQTGQRPSLGDIANQIEWQATKELARLRGQEAVQQGGNGAAPKAPAANGSRTMGATAASERRASPKAYEDMTPAEQRADDIRTFEEATRRSRL